MMDKVKIINKIDGASLLKRSYFLGDEHQINALYKLITGIERSVEEFRWEWVDTWNGQGDMWLGFEKNRKIEDRLILQYSLIPIPFSLWGERYIAGKTENCMCHSDYRSTGIYFSHEKEFFVKAKNRFQIFFTTSGNVSNGAAGAVRRKLGYIALDSWVNYFYCIDRNMMHIWLSAKLLRRLKYKPLFINLSSKIFSKIVYAYCSAFPSKKLSPGIRTVKKDQAPIIEIEKLWDNNKELYGISIERTKNYLDWRINQNPYVDHKYIFYYEQNMVKGYIIFYCYDNTINIVDLLSDNKDVFVLKVMVEALIAYGKSKGIGIIRAKATKNSRILKSVYSQCGFINDSLISLIMMCFKPNLKNPFHVFVPKEVREEFLSIGKDPLHPKNWYITEIIGEGRLPKA